MRIETYLRRRWWAGAAVTVLCWLAIGGLPAGETPEQAIQTIYGADIRKVRATPEDTDNLNLANKLVADARAMVKESAVHLKMLQTAQELALEAVEGVSTAETCLNVEIEIDHMPELEAWQELVTNASNAMRKRNKGADDPLVEKYCQWQLVVAAIARARGDEKLTDQTLTAVTRDAQQFKLKYLSDLLRQLQVYRKLDAAQRKAVTEAKDRVKGEDPKENLAAAETILSQSGDWNAAEPFMRKSQDQRMDQIRRMRQLRQAKSAPPLDRELSAWSDMLRPPTPPPAPPATAEAKEIPVPTAAETLALADYLTQLTAPQKRPSPAGKCALLEEAAALAAMVTDMDQSNLSVTQKLGLVTRIREAQETAVKARAEVLAAFDQECRLAWTPLGGHKLANDWTALTDFNTWKELEGGQLQCDGKVTSGFGRIKSKQAGWVNFVFESDFKRDGGEMGTSIWIQRGQSVYRVEIWSQFVKALQSDGAAPAAEKGRGSVSLDNEWHKLRVVFDGDRQRVWVDEKLVIDSQCILPAAAGGYWINSQWGTSTFRNLRIRELK